MTGPESAPATIDTAVPTLKSRRALMWINATHRNGVNIYRQTLPPLQTAGRHKRPAFFMLAAARLGARRAGKFLGGGMSKSAGTRNRARSRCTIVMLSPFLPLRTSLTRLG
jgi:hypothetical protein